MDFAKRMEIAVVHTYSKKKEEHKGISTSGERGTLWIIWYAEDAVLKFEGKASCLAEQLCSIGWSSVE